MQFTADKTGERVDVFLARVVPDHSRSFWQKCCELGQVSVEGATIKASGQLKPGERVLVISPETPDFSGCTLPILYEDDDVIVINKPAGLLTHAKGDQSNEFTVANFVRSQTTDGLDTNRPGIVHRLDRGTSGAIIAAKHPEAKRWLQAQFAGRKVKKTYIALVHGHLDEPEATLDLPIGRNPKRPQSFRVDANGRTAETHYKVIHSYRDFDLVELRPLTGRTHQLRVHLKYLGHPIVGDSLYDKPDKTLGRLFLHAHSLELTLPSRQRRTFTVPLPSELQTFLDTLQ